MGFLFLDLVRFIYLKIWLRCRSKIRLDLVEALWEFFDCFFVGNARYDDAIVAVLPVGGGRDEMIARELERIEHAKDFIEVAPSTRWIGQTQLELLVRTNYENRANGHRVLSTRRNHIVERSDLAIVVSEHREVDRGALGLFDIGEPPIVLFERIAAEPDDLAVALIKLGFDPSDGAQFGRAHWCEVFGVAKEHAPRITKPIMKMDRALC